MVEGKEFRNETCEMPNSYEKRHSHTRTYETHSQGNKKTLNWTHHFSRRIPTDAIQSPPVPEESGNKPNKLYVGDSGFGSKRIQLGPKMLNRNRFSLAAVLCLLWSADVGHVCRAFAPSALRQHHHHHVLLLSESSSTQLYVSPLRKPFITGNWKLNPQTKQEAQELAAGIATAITPSSPNADVALFVPFPFIETVQAAVGDKIAVGAEVSIVGEEGRMSSWRHSKFNMTCFVEFRWSHRK